MSATNRILSALVSVGYVLTITTAALFHNHAGDAGKTCGCISEACSEPHSRDIAGHEEERSCPAAPSDRSGDNSSCPVCQFLAQKPAPALDISPPRIESMIEEASAPAPARIEHSVFSAWQSRAPPSAA